MANTHEALQRPLVARTNIHWEGRVVDPLHFTNGKSTTAYEWLLKSNGGLGLTGGTVTVIPEREVVVFTDKYQGGREPFSSKNPEDALRTLDIYGWGEPPHFDEIVKGMTSFSQMRDAGIPSKQALGTVVEVWRRFDTPSAKQAGK